MRQEVSDDLFEIRNFADPDLIKSVQRAEHDKLLAQQMTGILTTRAAILGLAASGLPDFAELSGGQMAESIEEEPERYSRKLAEAAVTHEGRPTLFRVLFRGGTPPTSGRILASALDSRASL